MTVPNSAPAYAVPRKQGLSLTSLILGVVGILISWIPILGFFGFAAGIVAVILGFLGKSKETSAPKWMWIIGIVAGFVAIAISIVEVILFFVVGASAATATLDQLNSN